MEQLLLGILAVVSVVVGIAAVISVFIGIVLLPLCLIQRARGFRPRHTAGLTLSGLVLVGAALYVLVRLDGMGAPHGGLGTVSVIIACASGLWGSVCLLRAVPVNVAEMSKGRQ